MKGLHVRQVHSLQKSVGKTTSHISLQPRGARQGNVLLC